MFKGTALCLKGLYCIIFIISSSGVVALEGYLYAVGGYDSSSQLRTVERYCMVTDKWEFVAPMKSPRSALSVVVLGGKLYALGKLSEFKYSIVTD